MRKIPYGISYFPTLVQDGYYYVDRTAYIARLENSGDRQVFFLRPRRFGKSLWISTLQHYYGKGYEEIFETTFGDYYIGQHPTPLRNQYLMMVLDFSGINTDTPESTYDGFLRKVIYGGKNLLLQYSSFFSEADIPELEAQKTPEGVIEYLSVLIKEKAKDHKIYLLIDEYDHFANELISFRQSDFQDMVGGNGFVRKFYEAVKTATRDGAIDRMFVTGVSPLTLDSLTSGFNIARNLSSDPEFYDMMGFHETEVSAILQNIGVTEQELPLQLDLLRRWYNGYRFSEAGNRMYNPDMILYYTGYYSRNHKLPANMLDHNILSDYGKIRRLFQIGDKEHERLLLLDQLLTDERVGVSLTTQFSFERNFTESDFLSLLFYMGILTIDNVERGQLQLRIPNEVIRQLYFQYFHQVLEEESQQRLAESFKYKAISDFAYDNNPEPLMQIVAEVLEQLSNRDWIRFDEKHIKTVLISYLYQSPLYYIKSEYETGQKYVDLLLLRRPPYDPKYQFALELKYLAKKDETQLQKVAEEARQQLKAYLQKEELYALPDLKAWLVIFVGNEYRVMEEVVK
ncbi:MAG: AAA family ATPase [Bacteroidia bacterium]|nr:AAA family ATPase [Bacteroidia bacterium]